MLFQKYSANGLCSNTARKLLNVGGLGMKTGGYDKLSISFFIDSDNIHRNTETAGVMMTNTANAKASLFRMCRPRESGDPAPRRPRESGDPAPRRPRESGDPAS